MNNFLKTLTRRQLFEDCGVGLGRIGLASAMAGGFSGLLKASPNNPLAPRDTHFSPKAKRVIFLFMAGAPSQLELFDNKPKLRELDGKPIPPSVIAGQRYAFIQPDAAVLAPRFPFAKHGQSGAEISDRLPHLVSIADDIAIVKSMHTDQFNHAPA
ncbi:MAG: DUF1501 domain-containing protein, partial [Verrucomicrobiales bacterium]|nr:DUF1501 domain-containing protein [Verrucomicrobiales bacterium]